MKPWIDLQSLIHSRAALWNCATLAGLRLKIPRNFDEAAVPLWLTIPYRQKHILHFLDFTDHNRARPLGVKYGATVSLIGVRLFVRDWNIFKLSTSLRRMGCGFLGAMGVARGH